MDEIPALRSLPWHALQRRLANAIGQDRASIASWLAIPAPVPAPAAAVPGQSWLVRALVNVRPAV
jgi:hypothetical protein